MDAASIVEYASYTLLALVPLLLMSGAICKLLQGAQARRVVVIGPQIVGTTLAAVSAFGLLILPYNPEWSEMAFTLLAVLLLAYQLGLLLFAVGFFIDAVDAPPSDTSATGDPGRRLGKGR